MKLKIYPLDAKKTVSPEMEVPSRIFAVSENPVLVAQAVNRLMANRRRVIAHTKDRGEVSGGGRKPFKQKGTGQARAGSIRSPLWRGGGVVFGPRNSQNYRQKLPQKMLAKALMLALSEKVRQKKLIILDKFVFSKIKTREVQKLVEKLPIEEGKILLILGKTHAPLELSAANLPYLKVILARNINIFDLSKYDYLLTDREGLKAIIDLFKGN